MNTSPVTGWDAGSTPSVSFLARAQALVVEHAELFCSPTREVQLRVITTSRWTAGRPPPQRSPRCDRRQLKLPLRPSMRR